MTGVKDVQAVDNIVSQTITSTGREEPQQIGWNKRHAKGEARPLGTVSLSVPLEIQGLMLTQPWEAPPLQWAPGLWGGLAAAAVSLGAGQARTLRKLTPPPWPWKYAEICATSQTQGTFWSFKRKVKPFKQSANYIFLFHYNKEMDTSLYMGIQFIFLDFPASNTKWSVKINLEETSILPHWCSSDQCTSLCSPFSALQSNLLLSSK